VDEGLEASVSVKARRAMPAVVRIFDGERRRHPSSIALACYKPPKGRARWRLQVWENQCRRTRHWRSCQRQTRGRALQKTLFRTIAAQHWVSRRPAQQRVSKPIMDHVWPSTRANAHAMSAGLPRRESKKLIAKRASDPMKAGRPARFDSSTSAMDANLFMSCYARQAGATSKPLTVAIPPWIHDRA